MHKSGLLVIASSAVLLASCGAESVTHVRLVRSAATPPASMAQQPFAQGEPPSGEERGAEAGESQALQWTLPPGWTAKPETGMRYATLLPDGAAASSPARKVDVSVVRLPGMAGSELATVNRWRGQLGLLPVDDTQLAGLRKPMSSDAGPLELFDLASDGKEKSRMLVAVLNTQEGAAWFVKMTGAPEAVRARQSEFLRLLTSLRFGPANAAQVQP